MAGGVGTFAVDLPSLSACVAAVQAAADAARQVAEHPGVVRGRAQDGGNEELRDAAAELAERWQWALGQLAGEADRLADQLTLVVDGYAQVERQAVGAFAGVPWRSGPRQ